jgi:hypothetical protein
MTFTELDRSSGCIFIQSVIKNRLDKYAATRPKYFCKLRILTDYKYL